MELLKGAPVAASIMADVNSELAALELEGISPRLSIVRVGDKPDDIAYQKAAEKRCASVGIDVKIVILPETATDQAVLAVIDWLNADKTVHGILMLRPLPPHLNEVELCDRVAPEKDVDGVTPLSLAGVLTNRPLGFPPCTAQACMEILKHYGIDPKGKRAVVVGRSLVVGKPVSMLLLNRNATVTICHTKTKNLRDVCRSAELLIAAAGVRGLIDESYMGRDQTVVDVGIHMDEDGSMHGDVVYGENPPVEAITPVPGGVGSVTTAVLAAHVVEAARRSQTKS